MRLGIGEIAGEWLAAFNEVLHNTTNNLVQMIDTWIPGDISSVVNSKVTDKAFPTYTVNVGADLDKPITEADVYSEPQGVNRNLQDIVEVVDSQPLASVPHDVPLNPENGSNTNAQMPVYTNTYYYDSHDYFDYRNYNNSKNYVNNGLIAIDSNSRTLPLGYVGDSVLKLMSKNFYSSPEDVVANIYADLNTGDRSRSQRRRRKDYV